MPQNISNLKALQDSQSKTEWNQTLSKFENKNIFQSFEWGQLKKDEGWKISRISIINPITQRTILLAQVLSKKYFGITVAWCPGGPVIDVSSIDESNDALKCFKSIIFDMKIMNLRCNPYKSIKDKNNDIFNNLIKPTTFVTSPRTSILHIEDKDKFLTKIRRKHRYYYTQSKKHNIKWSTHTGQDASKTFHQVYEKMITNKNLKLSMINIENFAEKLGVSLTPPRLFTFAGAADGEIVSACVVSLLDKKAFYHYAASSIRGRKIFASYGMVINLISVLHEYGVETLDFGGLSKDGSNKGVDFFKEGFNGEEFNKVGEYDITKSKLNSFIFNKILKYINK